MPIVQKRAIRLVAIQKGTGIIRVYLESREVMRMSFGKNLQLLRKMRNKMTQEDLAEKVGVSRQTISKWELEVSHS